MNYHSLTTHQTPCYVKVSVTLAVLAASISTILYTALFVFGNNLLSDQNPLPKFTLHFLAAALVTLIFTIILNKHISALASLALFLTHTGLSLYFFYLLKPHLAYYIFSIVIGIIYAVCFFVCFYFKCITFSTSKSQPPQLPANSESIQKKDFNIFE